MTFLAYMKNQLALARKERKLKATREFLFILRDQVKSGQVSIRHYEKIEHQIECEIALLCPPDEIVRRSGAGA